VNIIGAESQILINTPNLSKIRFNIHMISLKTPYDLYDHNIFLGLHYKFDVLK